MNLWPGAVLSSPHRPYYGWYVVAACNAVAMMTWGIGVFNQGVFLGFFTREYGWSRSALSLGPTISFIWAGIVGMIVGRLIDRWGPRPVLVIGAATLGAGVTSLGVSQQLWHTYLAFPLMGTGYAFLHTVTLGAIISRWFVRERARAMAVATFGANLGGMLLPPLNAAVLERWGGLAGGLTLACIAIGMVIPLALWVVKDSPEALGLRTDGAAAARDTKPAPAATDEPLWTVAEAMRTPAFWAILLSFYLVMLAQGGFLVHQVLFLQPAFGLLGAATVVTATSAAGAAGRAGFALISHRLAPRQWAAGLFLFQAAGLLLSAASTHRWALIAGSVAFGLTMGMTVALHPVITADCFGRRTFGRIYGPIYMAFQLGTASGAFLLGLMAGLAGSYRPALGVVAAGLVLAAYGIRWALPPVQRMAQPEEQAMLQLRPNCECCDKDLPPESTAAVICSFECTFCQTCAETILGGVCPNCGGELVRRPRRPREKLAQYPASTRRILKPDGCRKIA